MESSFDFQCFEQTSFKDLIRWFLCAYRFNSKNNLNKLLSTIVECRFQIVSLINKQTSLLSVVWVYSQYFSQDDIYACKE